MELKRGCCAKRLWLLAACALTWRRAAGQEVECVADHGAKVGGQPCCHQNETIGDAKYICSEEAPRCYGFVAGTKWGYCSICNETLSFRDELLQRIHSSHVKKARGCHKDASTCKVALLVPTLGGASTADSLNVMTDSVVKTARDASEVGIFLAYDERDLWFSQLSYQYDILNRLTSTIGANNFSVHFIVNKGAKSYVGAVNSAAKAAYREGFDYFFQVNDDIRILTTGWDQAMKKAMQQLDGFGVTGPQMEGSWSGAMLFTEACVGRLHVCFLDGFFPSTFKNWFTDNWVTELYTKFGRSAATDVYIQNPHQHRYTIDYAGGGNVFGEVRKAYCGMVDKMDRCLEEAYRTSTACV